MKYERYEDVTVTYDYMRYEFISVGPKGDIPKTIQFSPTESNKIMNLAFGNKLDDGRIDDMSRDDNKDRNKILATVVAALKYFFEVYPDKWVFFTGSCPARTRLYRMVITLNYDELAADFEIFGMIGDLNTFPGTPFEKGVSYLGFIIRK